jgi:bifunctional UDP-N-acetylglucosamine pyrophosphorylase/glucosamine-1-phosphate N-acetyltransferase
VTKSRILIVPAAGLGSRLGANVPKLLVPVAGLPMMARLVQLYANYVDRFVFVVRPPSLREIEQAAGEFESPITCVAQPEPTGMLDAILLAAPAVAAAEPAHVWITWCDQVAVHPDTVARLAQLTVQNPSTPVVLPTARCSHPYVHIDRDRTGRIARILHRREGDAMPDIGESDAGLFSLSAPAYHHVLPEYAQHVAAGRATGERNFVPFIAWLAATHDVLTFACQHPMEAVGVNTPEDLKMVERYLRGRVD